MSPSKSMSLSFSGFILLGVGRTPSERGGVEYCPTSNLLVKSEEVGLCTLEMAGVEEL